MDWSRCHSSERRRTDYPRWVIGTVLAVIVLELVNLADWWMHQ